jgi:hypothetical protein
VCFLRKYAVIFRMIISKIDARLKVEKSRPNLRLIDRFCQSKGMV